MRYLVTLSITETVVQDLGGEIAIGGRRDHRSTIMSPGGSASLYA